LVHSLQEKPEGPDVNWKRGDGQDAVHHGREQPKTPDGMMKLHPPAAQA
jgi:hypothetical protein